jgi:hypothetical protein
MLAGGIAGSIIVSCSYETVVQKIHSTDSDDILDLCRMFGLVVSALELLEYLFWYIGVFLDA